jgi:hypothetical protein
MNHAIFEPSDSSSWTSSGEGSSYYVRSGDGSGGRQLRIQRKAIIAGGEKETVDVFFYFGVGPTLQRWLEPPDEATGFGSFFLARIRGLKDNTGWSDLISFLAWFSIFFVLNFVACSILVLWLVVCSAGFLIYPFSIYYYSLCWVFFSYIREELIIDTILWAFKPIN